jgi:ubiquinone/menaquinone biosynthesis C-methylase UbiE
MIFQQNKFALTLGEHVTPGCRWLDLGAGTSLHRGFNVKGQPKTIPEPEELAARASCLIGCDVVEEHLKANKLLTGYRVCRGESLPFEEGSFDLVTANMVLEHLTDPVAVFREAQRVLAPGGRFIAITPHKNHPIVWVASIALHPRWRSWFARLLDHRPAEHVFPTVYKANTVRAIERLAATVGLDVQTAEAFQSLPFLYHYGWLGRVEASFGWRNNLLVVLQKPTAHSGTTSRSLAPSGTGRDSSHPHTLGSRSAP